MLVRSLSANRVYNSLSNVLHSITLRSGPAFTQGSFLHCKKCQQNSSRKVATTDLNRRGDSLLFRHRQSPVFTEYGRSLSLTCQKQVIKKSTGTSVVEDDKPGMVTNMLDKVGLTGKLRYNRFKMRVAGLNMYKSCADGINVEQFFRACSMRDTLFSWFLVTELHVWMCMARLKQEGREGKYMTHYLVMSMWHDVQERGKVMGIGSVKMRDSLTKMVEQFNGALFAYDEGLLSSDRILAAALWRNVFLQKCEDPEQLLDMVAYIRKQMQYLDALDSAKLLQIGRIKWLPFEGGINRSSEPLGKAATLDEELNIPEFDKVPAV
ncbi:putative ubiquinol-cytochrome-c reductase complex assembly factor 1 [Apostichopus japonicus]|uniref:Putative ubiquinol-cytochrome-c reductase complex assembly factor 1 n=1 Tax=Stichopus japonicus TaxID=307972 RepID=A0A2G8JH52_STIJA|nr:putative ubiquinol-cytochrome-c reductase complex assembly factor 1 [Apostichopus japonicus]